MACAGDGGALGELVEIHRPWLRLLAKHGLPGHVQSRLDESDVVQQTCLSVFQKIGEFKGQHPEQFLAWLRKIHEYNLHNAVRDQCDVQKRDASRDRRYNTDTEFAALGGPTTTETPSQNMLYTERAVLLAAAIEQLPKDQAEAVRLRYLQGESLTEIAARMNRSYTAVVGLIRRGLQGMKKDIDFLDE
ncbi:ECF RNA polymerase sigma-E factor [Calycomorphotria hydatis]|uniref:ECF RNA polymerase sigma-E factor n=1 Tax=Calycomorphotria hydatis TaxID=2528027 RepID=A0A517T8J8_9PLAN|nr:ECF RNA polymerase sigma-E factor [Calycomorphotria hydatis]